MRLGTDSLDIGEVNAFIGKVSKDAFALEEVSVQLAVLLEAAKAGCSLRRLNDRDLKCLGNRCWDW